jgi:peptidoglycan/xylan/chitin deacetylase (PgdA/CDA1 family)
MTHRLPISLIAGLTALLALHTPVSGADGTLPEVAGRPAPALKLDRRSLAPAPDYALPGGGGTVNPARIAAGGWQNCALSFDDGPNEITPRILEILDREHVAATYFPIAATAARHPEVIRGFVAGGHEIGNHSLAHRNLLKLGTEAQRADLAEANRILSGLGATPVLFRPPYAAYDARLVATARGLGLQTVLWSLDVRDWEIRDAGMLAARVDAGAGPALVVLLHATYEWTERALPQIIASLRDRGCRFVTLSQWLAFMQAAPVAAPPAAALTRVAAASPDEAPPPPPAAPPVQVATVAPPPALFAPRAAAEAAPVAAPATETPPAETSRPVVAPATRAAPPRHVAVALTLRPARLEPGRGGKTELRIEGDGAVLQLGADADIDALAAQLKSALEQPAR